jgi:hypothetical protein
MKLLDPSQCYLASLDIGQKFTGMTLYSQGEHLKTFTLTNPNKDASTAPVTAFKLIQERLNGDFTGKMIVVIEDYAYTSGYFRVEQAEVVGQLKSFIVNNPQYVYVPLPPKTIKKTISGNGNATKSQVIKAVKSLGFHVNNSHEADSIAVGLTYFKLWQDAPESVYARSIRI